MNTIFALPSPNRTRFRLLSLSVVAATLLALVLLLVPVSGAAAHDELTGQSPAADEKLKEAPSEIKLTFSAELLDLGNQILVTNEAGENVASGDPQLQGFDITQKLNPDLPEGAYTVRWRVVSSDGHPISDSFRFAVGESELSEQPQATAPALQTQAPAPDSPEAQETPESAGSFTIWPWLIGGALLLALLMLLFFKVRSVKAGEDGTQDSVDSPEDSEENK